MTQRVKELCAEGEPLEKLAVCPTPISLFISV